MLSQSIFPPDVILITASAEMWETPVLEAEERLIDGACNKRRREFRAGRHCAHRALNRLGMPDQPILRYQDGSPIWPDGYLGSITHCRDLCLAACARHDPIRGIGLDVEPLEPLKPGLASKIQIAKETACLRTPGAKLPDRLVFSAKESLYKCFYPIVKRFFGFHSVEIMIDMERQGFNFKPSLQTQIQFPGNLHFHGRYEVTETHLITGCFLLADDSVNGQSEDR